MASEPSKTTRAEKRRLWEERIQSFESSRVSQSKFCHLNNLKLHQFVYWKRKLRPRNTDTPSLVQVSVSDGFHSLVKSKPVRLVVGGNYRIEIERGFDPLALKQLIHVLGRM
jgi:hypothetical protein